MATTGPVQRLAYASQPDLRDMLLMAGVGQYTAAMSIPYMSMLPSTTEPYAQGVIQLVKGLQRLLVKQGAKLAVDGGMGERTVTALMRFAGPRWQEKNWAQLYADVISGKPWQGFIRNDRGERVGVAPQITSPAPSGLGDSVTDLATNPIVLAAGAFFVWWKWFRKPARGGAASATSIAGDLEDL